MHTDLFYAADQSLFMPDSLSAWDEVTAWTAKHPCPIYVLVSMPRLRFIPECVGIANSVLSVGIEQMTTHGTRDTVEFGVLDDRTSRAEVDPKDGAMVVYDSWGTPPRRLTSPALFLTELGAQDCDVRQYMHMLPCRVEYVGQTIQRWGKRNRIATHHRVPTIRREIADREPHRQLFVLLMNFDSRDGRAFCAGPGENFTSLLTDAKHQKQPPTNQMVNAIEASLIALFQPPYNRTFRDTFPRRTHTSYNWFYRNEINSIGIAFSGARWGIQLHGHGQLPQLGHAHRFRLSKAPNTWSLSDGIPMSHAELQDLAYRCG